MVELKEMGMPARCDFGDELVGFLKKYGLQFFQ